MTVVLNLVKKRFPVEYDRYLRFQISATLGALFTTALCFLLLWMYGFNIIKIIDKVLRYFNQGNSVFGLPFAYPFNQGLIKVFLKNRFWLMSIIVLIAVLYYKKRLNIYTALLCSLMIIFSFSGLSPHYFLWIMPLLLILGWYKLAALLNSICTIFFLFYYMNPLTNPEVPYQSMLSFAPLKTFWWIAPPAFLTHHTWLLFIRCMGNYVIPLFCFIIACLIVYQALLTSQPTGMLPQQIQNSHKRYWYLIVIGALSSLIYVLMLSVDHTYLARNFTQVIAEKMSWYHAHVIDGYVSGMYGASNPYNIFFVFIVVSIIWLWCSWSMSCDSD